MNLYQYSSLCTTYFYVHCLDWMQQKGQMALGLWQHKYLSIFLQRQRLSLHTNYKKEEGEGTRGRAVITDIMQYHYQLSIPPHSRPYVFTMSDQNEDCIFFLLTYKFCVRARLAIQLLGRYGSQFSGNTDGVVGEGGTLLLRIINTQLYVILFSLITQIFP